MQIGSYQAVGNQPQTNFRAKSSPNFQGIIIKQGIESAGPLAKIKIIPKSYIDAIINSPEIKKAGEIYNIVVTAFTTSGVRFPHRSSTPNISFSISENTFGNKVKRFFNKLDGTCEAPREYKMIFRNTASEETLKEVQNLTKADIDSFVKAAKEEESKMMNHLFNPPKPQEMIIRVK